jgi:hypothetical protein
MDKLIFNTENTSGQVKRANTTFSWNICEKNYKTSASTNCIGWPPSSSSKQADIQLEQSAKNDSNLLQVIQKST